MVYSTLIIPWTTLVVAADAITTWSYLLGPTFIDIHVQIPSFDNYTLVISLAIRQRSEDLKHLISGNGLPELQG